MILSRGDIMTRSQHRVLLSLQTTALVFANWWTHHFL